MAASLSRPKTICRNDAPCESTASLLVVPLRQRRVFYKRSNPAICVEEPCVESFPQGRAHGHGRRPLRPQRQPQCHQACLNVVVIQLSSDFLSLVWRIDLAKSWHDRAKPECHAIYMTWPSM
ncbi:hypothetical protein CEXT_643891 [Caerostris extrusa]|uniref:Uncharacterized protein n=1 Tax=Caerostris extrusa TaxID=172846 RepID=A0AAV4Y4P8_CAEEX|nr:hypothetical protein CEXT_643891 [Caerostris extrusa]